LKNKQQNCWNSRNPSASDKIKPGDLIKWSSKEGKESVYLIIRFIGTDGERQVWEALRNGKVTKVFISRDFMEPEDITD
jgi:hypothetical protein